MFWGGAVASWGALKWTHRTDGDAHRESVAALPMEEVVTVAGATEALWATLRESSYLTLGDVRDYKSQNFTPIDVVLDSLKPVKRERGMESHLHRCGSFYVTSLTRWRVSEYVHHWSF